MRLLPLPGTLLLTAIVAGQWLWSQGTGEKSAMSVATELGVEALDTHVSTPPTRQAVPLVFTPMKDARTITARPLFAPDRRPRVIEEEPVVVAVEVKPQEPVEITVLAAPPPPPDPEFRLHGLMVSDAISSALISVDGQPAKWIAKKELVFDWVLSDIAANTIILEQTGRRITVPLYPN